MSFLYKLISGYCDGYFDWNLYEPRIIILEGPTWVVCKYLNHDRVEAINFDSEKDKKERLTRWVKEYDDEEDWAE